VLDYAPPILFVVAVWWLSTAVVLRLVWLRPATHGVVLGVSGAFAVAAMVGAWWLADRTTVASAYLGFLCGLTVWGFHELTFLLGHVTGPHRRPCPPDARGWRRFALATATVIHHELALAATVAAFAALTWGAPNQIATGTFAVLWLMRLSAKLNIFLGVRNVSEDFVPQRIAHLLSYFRKASWNPLMPVSLIGAGTVVVLLARSASAAPDGSFAAVGLALVTTLLGLALLEHVFLALPVPDALLWRWVLHDDEPPASPELDGPGLDRRSGTPPLGGVLRRPVPEGVRDEP